MLEASHRIDDFEIIRPLGRGGMGVVYEAQQLNPARRVALKVLAPWLAENEDALNRFRREVDVLAKLDHPGIVHVITTGRTSEGIAYYTMKLIRGISLSELVREASQVQGGTLLEPTRSLAAAAQETPSEMGGGNLEPVEPAAGPPKEIIREYVTNRFPFIVRVGISAARALHAAHQIGQLHRDIKPSNMMIDHHGQLYLVDFGLTRALNPSADVSQLGSIRGTPWYMSPEQARGASIDQRSDIYSLGVSLYQLATCGTGPFTANRDDTESVLEQVRAGMHLPLRVLAAGIPRDLERVILRAIQLKPKRRYQDAAEMAADLERILPASSGLVIPSKSRILIPPNRSRNRWLVGLSCACAAILAGVVIFRPPQPINEPSPPPPGTTTPPTTVADDPPPSEHDDYPAMLRNPPPGTAVPLFKGDMTPVWRHTPFLGSGTFQALPAELILRSPPGQRATLIPLGDSTLTEPGRPWFELSVELRPHLGANSNENQIGIFWGLPRKESETGRMVFFAAQFESHASSMNPDGRLKVGTSLFQSPDSITGRSAINLWMRGLPKGRAVVPLTPNPSPQSEDWRQMRLRIVKQSITVSIDERATVEFTTSWLMNSDPWFKGMVLEPRGTFGIWAQAGLGSFRNAKFTAISTD